MAESKRIFNAGKMNRDLDDRLIPAGEYRDALNIGVGRSEGSDVGAVENLKGNHSVSGGVNGTTIGSVRDPHTDRIYWFNVENEGTAQETSTLWEHDESTGVSRIILTDLNSRNAPQPTCAPEVDGAITDGNSVFGITPDFPDFPLLPLAACLDPNASNEQTASGRFYHDASICTYDIVGCMDPSASNYDPSANVAGTCTYPSAPTYTFADASITCSITQGGVVTVNSGDAAVTPVWDIVGVDPPDPSDPANFQSGDVPSAPDGTSATLFTILVSFLVPSIPSSTTANGFTYANAGQYVTPDNCIAYRPAGDAPADILHVIEFVNGPNPGDGVILSGGGEIIAVHGTTVTTDLPSFTMSPPAGMIFNENIVPTFTLNSGDANITANTIVTTGPTFGSWVVQIDSITLPTGANTTTVTLTWGANSFGLLFGLSGSGTNFDCAGYRSSIGTPGTPGFLPAITAGFEGQLFQPTVSSGTITAIRGTSPGQTDLAGAQLTVFPDRTSEIPAIFDTAIPSIVWDMEVDIVVPSGFANVGDTLTVSCQVTQDGKQPETVTATFTSAAIGNTELEVTAGNTFTGVPGQVFGPTTFRLAPSDGFEFSGLPVPSVTPDSGELGHTFTLTDNSADGNGELVISDITLGSADQAFEIMWDTSVIEPESTDTTITVTIIAPTNSTLPDGSTSSVQELTATPGSTGGFGHFETLDPAATYTPNVGFLEDGGTSSGFFTFAPGIVATNTTGGASGYEVPPGFFGDTTQLFGIGFAEWPSTDGTITLEWPTSDIIPTDPIDEGYLYYVWTNGVTPSPSLIPGSNPATPQNAVSCGIRIGDDSTGFTFYGSGFGAGVEIPFRNHVYSCDQNPQVFVITGPGDYSPSNAPRFEPGEISIGQQNQLSRQNACANANTIEPVMFNGQQVRNGNTFKGGTRNSELAATGLPQGQAGASRIAGHYDRSTGFLVTSWPYDLPSGYNGPGALIEQAPDTT